MLLAAQKPPESIWQAAGLAWAADWVFSGTDKFRLAAREYRYGKNPAVVSRRTVGHD